MRKLVLALSKKTYPEEWDFFSLHFASYLLTGRTAWKPQRLAKQEQPPRERC